MFLILGGSSDECSQIFKHHHVQSRVNWVMSWLYGLNLQFYVRFRSLWSSNMIYIALSGDFQANSVNFMFDFQLSGHHPIAFSVTLPSFGHHSTAIGPSKALHSHN